MKFTAKVKRFGKTTLYVSFPKDQCPDIKEGHQLEIDYKIIEEVNHK